MLSWSGCILWDNESFFYEPFVVSNAAVSGGVAGPIKRMGITGRNKYVESGGAGRAGRPDQMVTQSLHTRLVC